MKTILVALVSIVVFTSCGTRMYSGKAEPCATSATGDTITLAYRQPAAIFEKCADHMRASVTSIKDSRCPKGVQCVWAGTVTITLALNENFSINLEAGKQVDTTYNRKKYSFTLLDVTPYPVANMSSSSEEAKAVIRITKSEAIGGLINN